MVIAGIMADIGQLMAVTLVICGVLGILLAIHCFSEYMKRGKDKISSTDSLDELRREYKSRGGITPHNILYRFFFR